MIDSRMVDMKGNGYSRPNKRRVKSPGNRPMPSFFIQGMLAERIDRAINVVSIHRIMRGPAVSFLGGWGSAVLGVGEGCC